MKFSSKGPNELLIKIVPFVFNVKISLILIEKGAAKEKFYKSNNKQADFCI